MRSSPGEEEFRISPGSARRVALNSILSVAALLVDILAALLITPFLIRSLGIPQYGTWVLVMSFVGYSAILSLGFNAAVSREVARTSVSGDRIWANQVVNTATGLFLVGSVIALATLTICSFFLHRWFNIPPELHRAAQIALVIMALELALRLPLSIFPSILAGQQRYVASQSVRIVARVAYVAAVVLALRTNASLVVLSLIVLATSLLRHGLQWHLVRGATPWLQFGGRWILPSVVRKLAGFSISSFIYIFSQQIMARANYFVIGIFLTAGDVGAFNVPSRLVEMMLTLAVGMTIVVMPVASELEAKGDIEKLRAVFFLGTKYVVMMSIPVLVVYVVFGRNLISLWVGNEFIHTAPVLVILAVAVGFQVSQTGAFHVLMGMGKHIIFSWITISTAILTVALSVVFIRVFRLGLEGAALANLICYAIAYGVVLPIYACKQLKLRFARYWSSAIGKPVLLILPVGSAGLLMKNFVEPSSAGVLVAELALIFVVHGVSSWFAILSKEERQRILRVLKPTPLPELGQ